MKWFLSPIVSSNDDGVQAVKIGSRDPYTMFSTDKFIHIDMNGNEHTATVLLQELLQQPEMTKAPRV